MHRFLDRQMHWQVIFWFKYDIDRSTTHLKFNPTGVRTHDIQNIIARYIIELGKSMVLSTFIADQAKAFMTKVMLLAKE